MEALVVERPYIISYDIFNFNFINFETMELCQPTKEQLRKIAILMFKEPRNFDMLVIKNKRLFLYKKERFRFNDRYRAVMKFNTNIETDCCFVNHGLVSERTVPQEEEVVVVHDRELFERFGDVPCHADGVANIGKHFFVKRTRKPNSYFVLMNEECPDYNILHEHLFDFDERRMKKIVNVFEKKEFGRVVAVFIRTS